METIVNDNVNQPDHYQFGKIEVIQLTEQLDFCRGNVVKYVCRAGKKTSSNELEDLLKAAWYLQREIDRVSKNSNA